MTAHTSNTIKEYRLVSTPDQFTIEFVRTYYGHTCQVSSLALDSEQGRLISKILPPSPRSSSHLPFSFRRISSWSQNLGSIGPRPVQNPGERLCGDPQTWRLWSHGYTTWWYCVDTNGCLQDCRFVEEWWYQASLVQDLVLWSLVYNSPLPSIPWPTIKKLVFGAGVIHGEWVSSRLGLYCSRQTSVRVIPETRMSEL